MTAGKTNITHAFCLRTPVLYCSVRREILPFTQPDSQLLSPTLLYCRQADGSLSHQKRGSLITVKPGYIMKDMSGGGGDCEG